MSVTEVKQALGSWSLKLRSDVPRAVLDQLAAFGHVAVIPGDVDVATVGDNLLKAARYVGVVRGRSASEDQGFVLSGSGMAYWLGDEDGKGAVLLANQTFTASTFAATVRALLPPSVIEGNLYTATGTYTGTHQYQTPRDAITYVTDTFGTTNNPVSWRVNGDASVDAGPDSNLFVTTPKAILVRKEESGRDMFLVGYDGNMSLDQDVEDYTTKVVLLAEGEGGSTVTASASLVTPYKDIRGNAVNLTRLVSEFETDATNAPARAQLQLNRFTNPRFAVDLSSDDYDVRGDFAVGDTIWVYDPDVGFTDPTSEVYWKGRPLNPKALNVNELTWPIPAEWTVAYRTQEGVWVDLSDYYQPESGATAIVVGDFSQSLSSSSMQPVGDRPLGDSSVPAAPVWGTFSTGSYLASTNGSGDTRAQIQPTWTQPLNTDGSTVLDGAYYEIQYHPTSASASPWNSTVVSWGATSAMITELVPGTYYDFRIRAVDAATPPNISAWSTTSTVLSSVDSVAPSTPAAPSVAASLIAVQVSHTLGLSTGGTYNLEFDLNHLEVHAGASAAFTPDATTRLGRLVANAGNLRGAIPAVGTFNISSTAAVWVKVIAVDNSGNKSAASTGASATATLIDTAHISDLSVSKVTAGTIGATWIQGGTITTATSGARVELAASGLNAYDASGVKTVEIKGSDGSATVTGTFRTDYSSSSNPYMLIQDSSDRTTIYMYNAAHSDYAFINSPQVGTTPSLGMNSGSFTYASTTTRHRLWLANASGIYLESTNASGNVGGRLVLGSGTATLNAWNNNGTSTGAAVTLSTSSGRFENFISGGAQTGGSLYIDNNIAILARNGSGTANGGQVYLDGTGTRIGAYNTGTLSSEIAVFDDESIWLTGKFPSSNAIGGDAALFVDIWNTGGGNNAYVVTFGTTMGSTLWPLVTTDLVSGTASSAPSFTTYGLSTTQFTIWISSTANYRFHYWCYRRT